jgi:hypothetical protein
LIVIINECSLWVINFFLTFFFCVDLILWSVEVWAARRKPMKNGTLECSVCHSKLVSPNSRTYSKAYDRHKIRVSSKQRALNVLLVVGDCVLVGLQVISCLHDFSLSSLIWVHLNIVCWKLGRVSYLIDPFATFLCLHLELCFADWLSEYQWLRCWYSSFKYLLWYCFV